MKEANRAALFAIKNAISVVREHSITVISDEEIMQLLGVAYDHTLRARLSRLSTLLDEAEAALKGMLRHTCVADAHPEDKDGDDHAAESVAISVAAKIAWEKSDEA